MNRSQKLLERFNKLLEDTRSPDLSKWINPLKTYADSSAGGGFRSSDYYDKAKKKIQSIAKKAHEAGYINKEKADKVIKWNDEKANRNSVAYQAKYYASLILQDLKAW